MGRKGVLYWITGLSGAGKTTIGNRMYYELLKENDNVVLLDGDFSADFDRDTNYWNKYYESKPPIETPSLFAVMVAEQLKKGKSLLELCCGNGGIVFI